MHVLPALFLLIIEKRFGVGWVIFVYPIYIAFNKGDFVHVHVQG